ncbi:DUF5694 domain-containing protein [Cytobacillus sp. Hz8]|uniref:DUF5694 domain-containing protein n=1 Tax=Cytobacillus sp. Hz8 TaxID=3347168 RepID=UPI0035DA993E
MYKNIVELIESDAERIFALYGEGHLHLLNHFLMKEDFLKLRRLKIIYNLSLLMFFINGIATSQIII